MNSAGKGAATMMDMENGHHTMEMVDTAYDQTENCCADDTNCPMLSCMSTAIFAGPFVGLPHNQAGVQPQLLRVSYYPPEQNSLYRPPIFR